MNRSDLEQSQADPPVVSVATAGLDSALATGRAQHGRDRRQRLLRKNPIENCCLCGTLHRG